MKIVGLPYQVARFSVADPLNDAYPVVFRCFSEVLVLEVRSLLERCALPRHRGSCSSVAALIEFVVYLLGCENQNQDERTDIFLQENNLGQGVEIVLRHEFP